MPTTWRITLSMGQGSGWVSENLDDVENSAVGFHSTISTPLGTDVEIPWPTTGETQVYIRFPQGSTAYTVVLRSRSSDSGWQFQVPIGQVSLLQGATQLVTPGPLFTSVLVQKPTDTQSFFINTSQVQTGIGLFFW